MVEARAERHSLIKSLFELRGNPRGCVYAEPIWGIPYNLFAPYQSVFMVALGLADSQIGLIVTVSGVLQVFLAILSGPVTDKLGRRWTTLLFDLVAWSLSSLIAAFAQDFWWFLVAGLVNSFWRFTQNSWTCLLIEDADKDQLVPVFSWIYIANTLVGFVAPLAGILIARFTLVPTTRGLYLFAVAMFSIKAFVTFFLTKETAQGRIKMEETRGASLLSSLRGYGAVLRKVLRSPDTLYLGAIMIILNVAGMVSASFWGILATKKLGLPDSAISYFPFIKSTVLILMLFLATPSLAKLHFRIPMAVGFALYAAAMALYATAPVGGFAFLVAGAILEAGGMAVANPLVDRMNVLAVDPKERARIQSMLFVCVILVSSPFGWIAGILSQADKGLPFFLGTGLYAAGAFLSLAAGRREARPSVES
jgi:MFS family permease